MLISDSYRQLNAEMHRTKRYGEGGGNHAKHVQEFIHASGAQTVLDYGCGKGRLKEALGSPDWVSEYDPAIEGKDAEPEPADLVVCTDVLEHIEPECLDAVIDHIRSLSKRWVFLVIHTGPAMKHLPDGRNAHLTQENGDWWRARFGTRWRECHAWEGKNGFFFVGEVNAAQANIRG